MIRSHPEGALVYLNGQELGRTPIATNFTYYGDFEVKLVKDGYETETIIQPVPMPWYQVPPLDFVSENLVPSKIHDQRTLSFNLRPKVAQSPEQIRAAAEQLRTASRAAIHPPLTPAFGESVPLPPATNMLPTIEWEGRGKNSSKVELSFRDQSIEVNDQRKSVSLGRADDNDLVIKGNLISRIHAKVEMRRGKIMIVDQSTNGTFLLNLQGIETFIRRDIGELLGEGTIGLGKAEQPGASLAIHFKTIE